MPDQPDGLRMIRMNSTPQPLPSKPHASLQQLGNAPHRLMFFIGASNLLLAMLWWAAWLVSTRWQLFPLNQPSPYAGWLHGFVMQYQMLPSFMFGFLLTTFPRWMGLPDIPRWRYLPIGIGMFGGQLATLLGAIGFEAGMMHARSCVAAFSLGLIGLLAWGAVLLGASPTYAFASIKIGTFGLILPVYVTVAHRMFPFFAGNAVRDYTPWRPMWLLGVFWVLSMLHLALELVHGYGLLWIADLPLLALTATMALRWWPRGNKPRILSVLFLALTWLPIAFALYSAQSLAYAATGVYWLGRAPAHALFIGFFGSALVAMVTRVTQGHSGRPMTMPAVAWFTFIALQVVTLMRIVAEIVPDNMAWQAAAAIGWLVALTPWVLRMGLIYLSPRADGKPG